MRLPSLIMAIVSFALAIALYYYTSVTVCVDYMDAFVKYGSSCPVYFSIISAGILVSFFSRTPRTESILSIVFATVSKSAC